MARIFPRHFHFIISHRVTSADFSRNSGDVRRGASLSSLPTAHIDGFVAGHGKCSKRDASMTLDIPVGSQQNAAMNRLFLQPR